MGRVSADQVVRLVVGFAATCTIVGTVGCANPTSSNNSSLSSGIIGGTDATGSEDFIHSTVSLYNTVETSLCTASLLSDSIAVTAAHCVSGADVSSLRVIFGKNLLDGTASAHQVVAAEANPLYATNAEQQYDTGDIAIVRFSGGLPAGYVPAQLLDTPSALQNGAPVLLAGYGINDGVKSTGAGILRFVQTTIENAAYSKSEVLIDQTQGKGACHGDSGGPAFVQVNGKWALWGVTNRGVNDPSNDCSVASAYTNIPFYKDWVVATTTRLMSQTPAPAPEGRRPARQRADIPDDSTLALAN